MATQESQRIWQVRKEELAEVFWSALTFFLVLSSYYILRPVRDEIGAHDRDNLDLLWKVVFFVMLAATPLYFWVVKRFWHRRLVAMIYRFFAVNLLVFYALLQLVPQGQLIWVERVFYVWMSIFNLFVVAVLWALLADRHTSDESKRLFGIIALGGTLGGILGSSLTAGLSYLIAPIHMLLVSAAMLELACRSATAIYRHMAKGTPPMAQARIAGEDRDKGTDRAQPSKNTEPPPGILQGLAVVFRSPYLLRICVYILLYSLTSTFLYFQKADIVREAFTDRAARTSFFASVDLISNLAVAVLQLFVTGQVMKRLGVGIALLFIPVISAVGFALLGAAPTLWAGAAPMLWIIVAFETSRNVGRYSFGKPARDALYTVVSRQEKYQSKVFIDTVVYRGSDVINSMGYEALADRGVSASVLAFIAVPLALVWGVYAHTLGRAHEALAKKTQGASGAQDQDAAAPSSATT